MVGYASRTRGFEDALGAFPGPHSTKYEPTHPAPLRQHIREPKQFLHDALPRAQRVLDRFDHAHVLE